MEIGTEDNRGATPAKGETPTLAPRPAPPRRPARIMRQFELVERVKAYDPSADELLLNRAYVYAMKAHGQQFRANGDPYISHPVEVAGVLTQYKLDAATIATALLHDVVEDTEATLDHLETLFGREIRQLVDGVTKLNKLDLKSPDTAQAENFRKLLLAMSADIRVLLVKLADRLHNMRTLHFINKPDKRARIARETQEIYAPLAERIGMQALKDELDDLVFQELHRAERQAIIDRLAAFRAGDDGLVRRIETGLRDLLHAEHIEAKVIGRQKTPHSIWQKMQRKNVSFEQLSDIMAFRVVVGSVSACYAALGAINAKYRMLPGRFKDYISTPKPNGYRSLHTTVIGPEDRSIEVQIRTQEMHDIGELGVAAHWSYKQQLPTDGSQYRFIRGLLDILEHASTPEEFLEHTKMEMFSDSVFCFTPRGDLIELPSGATPVDFAYAVHSEVGDRCSGARVNGKLVQLRRQLQNGDIVEITTSKQGGPSANWERFAVTGKARARIRRSLRLKRREATIGQQREALARAAAREAVAVSEKQLDAAAKALGQAGGEELLLALGDNRVQPRQVLEAVHPHLREQGRLPGSGVALNGAPPALRGKTAEVPSLGKPIGGAVTLHNLPQGMPIKLAGCCRPLRGERIVGVIRTGIGVTVHAADCGNLLRYNDSPDRLLDLNWKECGTPAGRLSTRLRVGLLHKPGALGSLTTTIGAAAGNITDLRFNYRSDDLFEMMVDVEVEDLAHLNRLLAVVRGLDEVATIERFRE